MWFRVLTPTLISQLGRLLSEAGRKVISMMFERAYNPVLTPSLKFLIFSRGGSL
nr:MAG TPA: hypothetical protein [Bacteriophage sp.]